MGTLQHFKSLTIGTTFWFNGFEYTKKTKRTANIHWHNETRYFGQKDTVRTN